MREACAEIAEELALAEIMRGNFTESIPLSTSAHRLRDVQRLDDHRNSLRRDWGGVRAGHQLVLGD